MSIITFFIIKNILNFIIKDSNKCNIKVIKILQSL